MAHIAPLTPTMAPTKTGDPTARSENPLASTFDRMSAPLQEPANASTRWRAVEAVVQFAIDMEAARRSASGHSQMGQHSA